MSTTECTTDPDVPTGAVGAFFAIAFGIAWGLIGCYIFAPVQMAALFGEISGTHPFYFIATWSPAIAGFVVVFFYGGLAGLRAFLSRIFLWRIPVPWALLIIVGFPLVFIAGSLIKGGPALAPLPPEGLAGLLVLTVIMLFLGPIEEFGWRGVAQPLLQRRMAPVWAGALIGALWGTWHLPAFFLSGVVYADWDFATFLTGSIALGILVTPILNASRGSILWPMLFHWQLILPIWPDAQPWDTWMVMALAAIVVWLNRETMLVRHPSAVTEVIPQPSRARETSGHHARA